MKTKVFLPLIAVICAIGMAFATADTNYSTATGFIETAQGWEQVEVECEEGINLCRAYFESNPQTVYTVYSAPNSKSTPLDSPSPLPIMISD